MKRESIESTRHIDVWCGVASLMGMRMCACVQNLCQALGCKTVIIDEDLTPSQQVWCATCVPCTKSH
jgi:hypothetical protein